VSDAQVPELFIFTDRVAARGQLETAVTLWFEEKDESSIHTLAVAAQGMLNQMCKDKKIRPSQIHEMVEQSPKKVRDALRAPQNFNKHGRYKGQKRKGEVGNTPIWTELILADCLSMHQRLFDGLSPMMLLYGVRYALLNPRAFPMKITVKGIKIEKLRRLSRRQFLEEVFPRMQAQVGDLSAHLGKPPEVTEIP
jgi:hypothetical protein